MDMLLKAGDGSSRRLGYDGDVRIIGGWERKGHSGWPVAILDTRLFVK